MSRINGFLVNIYLLSSNIMKITSLKIFFNPIVPIDVVNEYKCKIWTLIITRSRIVSSAANLVFSINSDRVFFMIENESNKLLIFVEGFETFSGIFNCFRFL